jgi:hypothetical protein
MGSKNVQYLSMILFMIGVVAGLFFSGVAVWADFEASMFDSSLTAEEAFPDFRCPIMIGQNQTGVISGRIENTSKYNLQFFIRAHATSGSIITMDEWIDRPVVPAGISQPIQWEVSRSNAIWENFILFRAYQYRYAPVPSRASSCGIMVSPIPGISGTAAVGVLIGISLVGMGAGLVLWFSQLKQKQGKRREAATAMLVLAVFVVAGLAVNLLGFWLLGFLLIILTVLAIFVMMVYFVTSD